MSAPTALTVLRRTSEGLHGIADGCANPELALQILYQGSRIAEQARDQADALLAALAGGAK